MKKLICLFACTALFAACSSDDSNQEPEVTPPAVTEPTKSKVIVSKNFPDKRGIGLYELDPSNGKFEMIKEFEEIDNMESINYDAVDKKLYGISFENQLLKFDLEKKETVFIKDITPTLEVDIDYSFIDKRGELLAYGYDRGQFDVFNSFITIDKEKAIGTPKGVSKELNKKLEDASIFYLTYNEQQDRVVAFCEESDYEKGVTNFSLLLLNPHNLADFDTKTEEKTIAIKELNYQSNAHGIVVDKNQNYFIAYDKLDTNIVALVDTKTGELNNLLELFNLEVMAYDKNMNSLYFISGSREDKKLFTTYNIDTKEKSVFVLGDDEKSNTGMIVIN